MIKWLMLVLMLGSLVGFYAYEKKESDVYVAERQEEVKPAPPLLFTGDIMLGRFVESLAKNEQDELRSFRKVHNFLKEHVTIANLEGPIPVNHRPTLVNGMSFSFASSTPKVLKDGGVTAVSLANNHMFDQGRNGYEETKLALDREGIAHFGGYAPTEGDYFEAELGDQKAIIFGITMIATGFDEAQSLEVAKNLRVAHSGAYLVAFLHWGNEYVTQSASQRDFAHKLIDLGVDAIIGAHPHVVQGVELYNGKPIFYSLGNFIFDQYWRKDLEDGFLVRLTNATSSYHYDLIPIHSVRSAPYIATSTKRDQILSNISKQSGAELKDAVLSGRLEIRK